MIERPENYQGRRRAEQMGAHRAPAFARGTHGVPAFARGAHAAPVSIQAGQTATAAVFGVAAAAVALGSAASGADNIEATGELPRLDSAADHQDAARAADTARQDRHAEDVATRPTPRNEAVRALTTAAPQVTVKSAQAQAARPVEKVVVKTARAQAAKVVAARKAAARTRTYSHPMPGAAVTSCFGQRWGALHAGIDFAKPAGTHIRAVQAGRVVAAGWNYGGYGISVMLRHADGTLTHYAHMSKTAVKAGDRVGAGDTLGYEGSTGDSTGPHLHFEVHKGIWNQVDPAGWLAARGVRTSC
ncbi:hypothetical protein GCM10010124_03660 [Pilimelia terevasa]|uniref:M23ase beta-sheet core domain-containing protein n=1 Tax=Pilimelia terevasa TaxID=53372 RepID=A0A8J3BJ77_9ACTN|nr:M23 family metallopeptidase [Pilimelia terevasa]GGK14383.1 hypothetical protein GCM10010124_03660 [Pilimelia terevasa]